MNSDLFNDDILSIITKAASNRHIVHITYCDSKGNVTVRDTEPYEIKDGKYFGYTKDGIRGFVVDRIKSAKEMNTTFIPRWPIKI